MPAALREMEGGALILEQGPGPGCGAQLGERELKAAELPSQTRETGMGHG